MNEITYRFIKAPITTSCGLGSTERNSNSSWAADPTGSCFGNSAAFRVQDPVSSTSTVSRSAACSIVAGQVIVTCYIRYYRIATGLPAILVRMAFSMGWGLCAWRARCKPDTHQWVVQIRAACGFPNWGFTFGGGKK